MPSVDFPYLPCGTRHLYQGKPSCCWKHCSPLRLRPQRFGHAWTNRDPVLAKIRNFVLQGWLTDIKEESWRPYFNRKEELGVQDGCLLWGARVIVPPRVRSPVMELLHEAHPGVSRIKSLARSYMWWPGMDQDLEVKVKSCPTCQENRTSPSKAPLHVWEWPERPWARVHADFAGPFMGKTFLVLVDAHSKWFEVVETSSITSACTILKLRTVFATHGLPETLVTDNGPAFISDEFTTFLKQNGIKHVRTSPYHPASNGLAERAMQSFKAAMKKSPSVPFPTRVARFLFQYRLTPHTTTW